MPGLLRGVARTAVAAGTFTAVSNNVSRRQGKRWAAKDAKAQAAAAPPPGYVPAPQYAPAPAYAPAPQYAAPPAPAPVPAPAAAASMDDRIAQLSKLGELKAAGILTEAEFAAQKARVLAG